MCPVQKERVRQGQGQLDQYVEFKQDSPPPARPISCGIRLPFWFPGLFSIFSKEGLWRWDHRSVQGISPVRIEYKGRRSCRSIAANQGLIFSSSLSRLWQKMDLEHATGRARAVVKWWEYRWRAMTGPYCSTVKQPVDRQSLTRINNRHTNRHRSAAILGQRLVCLRKGPFLQRWANLQSGVGAKEGLWGHVYIFDSPLAPICQPIISNILRTEANGAIHIRGSETVRS